MSPNGRPSPAAAQASLRALASQRPTAMQVAHALVDGRANVLPRFDPATLQIVRNRWRRIALFEPCAVCSRAACNPGDHSTALWQPRAPRAPRRHDDAQRVVSVQAGARLPLHGDSQARFKVLLAAVIAIGAFGDDERAAAVAQWCEVRTRLVARQPSPVDMAKRHAVHLAHEARQ